MRKIVPRETFMKHISDFDTLAGRMFVEACYFLRTVQYITKTGFPSERPLESSSENFLDV